MKYRLINGIDCLLFCLVSTVSGRRKNARGGDNAGRRHITKLEYFTFDRYQ